MEKIYEFCPSGARSTARLSVGIFLPLIFSLAAQAGNPWGQITTPSKGTPETIGYYSAGCVSGASALAKDGDNYQVMRLSRNRYYGHPNLVNFLEWLTQQAALNHAGSLLIGDLGQPRGGPMPSGHVSHQVGLDVDIWFWQPTEGQRVTNQQRESLGAQSMLTRDGRALDLSKWNDNKERILEIATRASETQRIFVNALIKKHMCLKYDGASWLRKLRPWPGHHDHFHVRLQCPQGSSQCQRQDPIPPGSGCDSDLDEMVQAQISPQVTLQSVQPSERSLPELPIDCEKVLKSK